MPRAEGSVSMTHPPSYAVEAWLEATPTADGCKLQLGTRIADKKLTPGFLVSPGVLTERLDTFTKPAPANSECETIECYRYYLHFVAAMGIGISISKTAGVSGTVIMAQHDHYVTLEVCSDGSSSSNVKATHTSGPRGDTVNLVAKAGSVENSKNHTF